MMKIDAFVLKFELEKSEFGKKKKERKKRVNLPLVMVGVGISNLV